MKKHPLQRTYLTGKLVVQHPNAEGIPIVNSIFWMTFPKIETYHNLEHELLLDRRFLLFTLTSFGATNFRENI